MDHTHVKHLVKRNDTLAQKVEKLKGRATAVTKHGVHLLEVTTGAVLGGVIQGMAKDQHAGAYILKVPADLGIGIGLNLAALLDLAGEEYSPHLASLGAGFIAAYASDWGHAVGNNKRVNGSFFKKSAALPAAAVHGEVSPQAMAEAILHQMQR